MSKRNIILVLLTIFCVKMVYLKLTAPPDGAAGTLLLIQDAWDQTIQLDGDTSMGNAAATPLYDAMSAFAKKHPQAAEEAATYVQKHGGNKTWH
jgi:hypothetical protein